MNEWLKVLLATLLGVILTAFVTYVFFQRGQAALDEESYIERLKYLRADLASVIDDAAEIIEGNGPYDSLRERVDDAVAAAIGHCTIIPVVCEVAGFVDAAEEVDRLDGEADPDLLRHLLREARQLLRRVDAELARMATGGNVPSDSGQLEHDARLGN